MGWSGTNLNGQAPIEYVRQLLPSAVAVGYGTGRNVDGTVYAAVRCDDDGPAGLWQAGDVIGLVVAVDYRDSMHWFKYMDEFMGPFYFDAPDSVLRKLTPLRPSDNKARENAAEWRAKCMGRRDYWSSYTGANLAAAE